MRWQELNKAERVKLVTDSWDPNFTAHALAEAVSQKIENTITRNAVIGIYDRNPAIKLSHPLGGQRFKADGENKAKTANPGAGWQRYNNTRARAAAPTVPKERKIFRRKEHTAFDQAAFNVPLIELRPGDCHWPTNDPEPGEQHLFCGFDTEDGHKYCPHHRKRSVL